MASKFLNLSEPYLLIGKIKKAQNTRYFIII